MTPYGEKAMIEELAELRAAPQGNRNNALNVCAYRLAQLLGKGHLIEPDLVSELQLAGEAIGLSRHEADQTIRSAIKRGRGVLRGPEPGEYSALPQRSYLPKPPPAEDDSGWNAPFVPDPSGCAPTGVWQQKAEAMVHYAREVLFNTPDAVAWLADRGISEKAAKAWWLGWFGGDKDGKDLFRPRESWGLGPALKDDGTPKKLWIPRGLVIPWVGVDGIYRIRIRRPEGEPRYYVLPGSTMDCLILPRMGARAYVVVESELDAVMIHALADDLIAVVALGNSSRKPDAKVWTSLQCAARVLVSLDNDPAGRKATEWWLAHLPDTAMDYPAPSGKDPGDAFKAGADIQEWIREGLPAGWATQSSVG